MTIELPRKIKLSQSLPGSVLSGHWTWTEPGVTYWINLNLNGEQPAGGVDHGTACVCSQGICVQQLEEYY